MGDQGVTGDPGQVISGGASVYINWGSRECPNNMDPVYQGIAVSPAFNNAGGGAEYLCLPDSLEPDDLVINSTTSPRSTLVGVHYETFADPSAFPFGNATAFQEPLHNNDGQPVVCSVCLISNPVVVVTPNNNMCPEDNGVVSWDLEYSGFLMAARDFIFYPQQGVQQTPVFGPGNDPPPHFRTEYVCVNANAEIPDPDPNPDPGPTTEANMAHVRVYCGFTPGLNNACADLLSVTQFSCFEQGDENGLCMIGPLRCSVCSASLTFTFP